MERVNFSPKYVAIGVVLLAAVDTLFMLLGAVLIERAVLAYDCAGIWSVVSLVSASVAANLFCAICTGRPMNAYVISALCFLILLLVAAALCDTQLSVAAAVKGFTALICGAFIGNFFGVSRHNRLRKIRKKKRLYTK